MNQWQVASRQPEHLVAMCVWEGASDWYRDATHHGGILSTFWANWYDMQVTTVQHGVGERGATNPNTEGLISGPETLSDEQLAVARIDFGDDIRWHPVDDAYHRERSGDWDRITVPLLSAGNWGGQGLHLRGNVEGFVRSASPQKWLEMHGLEHWTHFYTDYGVDLQKRFFGHFLKDEPTGWETQPPVTLQIRQADGSFVQRAEREWPLARTEWTELHLQADSTLPPTPADEAAVLRYAADGEGLSFTTAPFEVDTEITGPAALRVAISSQTSDADVFAILGLLDPEGAEVTFQGAIDPHSPLAQGWLRASHRRLDPELSRPYRPYHSHKDPQPLTPGEVVELDIEILPTSIVVPHGFRLRLTIQGHDYENPNAAGVRQSNFKNDLRGCGPFLHDDPVDRPPAVFGGEVGLHLGDGAVASLLLPVIAPKTA